MQLNRRTLTGPAMIFVIILSGCGSQPAVTSQPSASPALTGSPEESGPAACNPVDIHTPSGARVDLTGTWRGAQTLVYLHQESSCVWWMALSDFPGEAIGSRVMLLYEGNIHSDLTLRGEWMAIVKPLELLWPPRGATTFKIAFDQSGGTEAVVLRSLEPAPLTAIDVRPYTDVTLTRVGPLPPAGLP